MTLEERIEALEAMVESQRIWIEDTDSFLDAAFPSDVVGFESSPTLFDPTDLN